MHSGSRTAGLIFISLLTAATLAGPTGTAAQTATDLNCKGCVGPKELAKNAVRSNRIKDGTIKPNDLSKHAKPIGADSTSDFGSTATGASSVNVVSTTVTAPASGFLVAMASWYFSEDTIGQGGTCVLELEGGASGPEIFTLADSTSHVDAAAANAMFPVAAGDATVHLKCFGYPLGQSATIWNPTITAVFVHNQY